ncbi:MAG TPA: flagellar motor protein MotB [Myxococcales bacterium]|nr:flagellar motor protein MotB [Myxococcales bacterium]
MARRKKEEEHENHERWLVSYADFITLLFAFFVVMYSVSRVDNKRLTQAADAIRWAMHFGGTGGNGQVPLFDGPATQPGCPVASIGSAPPVAPAQLQLVENMRKKVEAKLKPFLASRAGGAVQLDSDGKRLTIRLAASHVFEPGLAVISPDALPVLDAIADELASLDRPVRVEGHTDETSVGSSRWKSNWELSASRAANVVDYLEREHHMPPGKLAAVGYGATRPISHEETPEARESNRRLAFVLEVGASDPLGAAAQ